MESFADWQSITSAIMFVGTVLGGSAAILLWIYRELNNIREVQNRLHVKLVEEFVSHEVLGQMEERLNKTVERIEGRLDRILDYIKLNGPQRTNQI